VKKIPGDYIAGFVDGEGCFALKFIRSVRHERKNKPVYFYWDIEFAIVLRGDDKNILKQIKETLGCGRISVSKRGHVRYSVNDINDLMNIVVPFFRKYRLRAKKQFDFKLWQSAIEILERNQQRKIQRTSDQTGFSKIKWAGKDLDKLKQIHIDMKRYKSARQNWKWLK